MQHKWSVDTVDAWTSMLFQKSHLHFDHDDDDDDDADDDDDDDDVSCFCSPINFKFIFIIDSHHEAEVPLASDLHGCLQ